MLYYNPLATCYKVCLTYIRKLLHNKDCIGQFSIILSEADGQKAALFLGMEWMGT